MNGARRVGAGALEQSERVRPLEGSRPHDRRNGSSDPGTEAVLRAVLDATQDAIRFVDLDGHTLIANAAARQFVRKFIPLPREGTIYERWRAITDQTTDPDGYTAALDALEADPEREALDEFQLAASGKTLQRYAAPVRNSAGALLGRILVHRDVTAEREAERVRSELLATVSHELRTPLTGILGFAELLLQPDLDSETHHGYVDTIHREAARLTGLVDNFLDLQHLEAGRSSLDLEPFDLRDVLGQAAKVFAVQSAAHTIELELPEAPLKAVGDAERITQVVANLLCNAIKYSPGGGVVRISAEARARALRVSVSDEGLGIPADQQPRVFTKFFRVDSSDTRRIGGTGLGLALSRELVEAHDGRIGFESVEGKGSTFWFELPVARPHDARGRLRVLVIEDDSGTAAFLSEQLSLDGYAVDIATSGSEGLRRAIEDPPALVCLDMSLPGRLNGWEVLERLKTSAATATVPVLVCSGYDGRAKAAALGAAGFVAKPFLDGQLRARVATVLAGENAEI